MQQATTRIGTSGWHYKHWIGNFYPPDLMSSDFLAFYCRHFNSAEINNSFYRLPSEKTLADWRDSTPPGFLFAIKASRYLTHMKKLKDPKEPLAVFLEHADMLGEKLGPILFQLPPKWHCNLERLTSFLDLLPNRYRCAFEFRDSSWFNEKVYQALRAKNAALCLYHLQGFMSPKEITADFVYVRLHGPGGAYQGSYETIDLNGWAGALSTWRRQGRDIFCYFDNDEKGYAAANAGRLKTMLDMD
jgi:uncharacterized protein YecE (DUF72 family)